MQSLTDWEKDSTSSSSKTKHDSMKVFVHSRKVMKGNYVSWKFEKAIDIIFMKHDQKNSK